jgi:membrane protein required for colicin V production
MNVVDLFIGVLLCYGLYKGFRSGFFVAISSLVALIFGVFAAFKFSYIVKNLLVPEVSWGPKNIEIIAFILTFVCVLIGIHFAAKLLTKIADFTYLGWINKLAGSLFLGLKTVLIISVLIYVFEKINAYQNVIAKETLEASMFYTPIKEIAAFMYPKIKESYDYFESNPSI